VYALIIGYVVTLFAPGHRTAYDRLAGTSVVRARTETSSGGS
jgi:hypothetical protein